jgi:hypothetical protein
LPLFLRSVVYVPSKIIKLFGPPTFGYEWTWWRLFQTRRKD